MQHERTPITPHLRIRGYRGHTVLELRGEIDISAAIEIIPDLDAATCGTAPHIIIDLRRVEFFDCSGLRLLYRARGRVVARGGRLLLVCTHPLTLRILQVTGLAYVLPPAASLDEAIGQPESASDAS